jgi:hypothetical protein
MATIGRLAGIGGPVLLIGLLIGGACSGHAQNDDPATATATQGALLSHDRDADQCCIPLLGQCKVGLHCSPDVSAITGDPTAQCGLGVCVQNDEGYGGGRCVYTHDADGKLVINPSSTSSGLAWEGGLGANVCLSDTATGLLFFCGTDGLIQVDPNQVTCDGTVVVDNSTGLSPSSFCSPEYINLASRDAGVTAAPGTDNYDAAVGACVSFTTNGIDPDQLMQCVDDGSGPSWIVVDSPARCTDVSYR